MPSSQALRLQKSGRSCLLVSSIVYAEPPAHMAILHGIQLKFQRDKFELSEHALDQSLLRNIQLAEIRQAIRTGEIIERYPLDKYYPSCLVLGFTGEGRPLHIQCSYPTRPLVKIITVYEPDPLMWIDYRKRRAG